MRVDRDTYDKRMAVFDAACRQKGVRITPQRLADKRRVIGSRKRLLTPPAAAAVM